jgi:hypothetical protein
MFCMTCAAQIFVSMTKPFEMPWSVPREKNGEQENDSDTILHQSRFTEWSGIDIAT